MVVTLDLDSFWFGFVGAWVSLFVVSMVVGLIRNRKK